MVAIIVDCFVCWAVRDLDLYSELPEEGTNGHLVEDKFAMKELQPIINGRSQQSDGPDEHVLLKKLDG